MKKALVTALVLAMAVSMAGCGGTKKAAEKVESTAAAAASTAASVASEAAAAVSEAAATVTSEAAAAVSEAAAAVDEAAADAASTLEAAADEAAAVIESAAAAVEELPDTAVSAAEEVIAEVEAGAADVVAAAESAAPVVAVEDIAGLSIAEEAESASEDVLSVMTYEEFIAAPVDTQVMVETYVQAKQAWWENKATLYTQDEDGAYFIYNAECSEEDYAALVEGQKIVVTGYKAEWAGEVEIVDATFEIVDGNYIAEAVDVSALLGKDELADSMNQKVAFKGLTVEAVGSAESGAEEAADAAFQYNWDGSGQEGDDLYFNASYDGATYTFVVESYLCDSSSAVYKAVKELKVGDKVDLEGFLYWYEGAQPHITSVAVAA